MTLAATLDTLTGPRTLDQIGAALESAWSVHARVPAVVRLDLSIAAGEIGANIVQFAGRGRSVRLRMQVCVLSAAVLVEFTDDGPEASIDLDSVRMPDVWAERGRGLAVALAALERLSYQRSSANHWTLLSKKFA